MNTQHTPGPWTQYEGEVRAPGHGLISRSYYGSPDGPGAANARLIAAAPDLLRFLALMFDAYENGTPCYIDPEDGGGYLGNAFQLANDDFHAIASLLNALDPRDAAIAKATGAQP